MMFDRAVARLEWEQSNPLLEYVCGEASTRASSIQMEKVSRISNMIAAPPSALKKYSNEELADFNQFVNFQKNWHEQYKSQSKRVKLASLKEYYPQSTVRLAERFAIGDKSFDSSSYDEVHKVYRLVQVYHDKALDCCAIYKNLSPSEADLYHQFERFCAKNKQLENRRKSHGEVHLRSLQKPNLSNAHIRNMGNAPHQNVHRLFRTG